MTHEQLMGRRKEKRFIRNLAKEIRKQKGLVEYLKNIRSQHGNLQNGKEQIIQDYKNGNPPIPFVGKVFEKKAIFESAQKAGGLDAVCDILRCPKGHGVLNMNDAVPDSQCTSMLSQNHFHN